jgi:hypothetical protein
MLGPVYRTKVVYKGNDVDVVFSPFANTGQWFRPGEQKPQKNAAVFTYGIWLYNTNTR